MAGFVSVLNQGMFGSSLHGPEAVVLYTFLGIMTILWHLHPRQEDDLL